jgi:DNA gyrase subunit A
MGKYHPHGDSSIYDALVRMAQPFAMRYPLVDGQGNFGSVDGDPPAAMRYTEARLSRIATALLEDIDKETVDFKPNYDESEQEPEVLPTRVPNLLVNGSSGIAVGMATNIPAAQPHRDHRRHHPPDPAPRRAAGQDHGVRAGPRFPHRRLHPRPAGHLQAYMTGRGQSSCAPRPPSRRCPRTASRSSSPRFPTRSTSRGSSSSAALVNEKKLEGIGDIRDESDRDGMRIVFELKRGEQAEVVLNNLYKHTQLQTGFGIIMLSIVNGQPRELGLVDCIKFFIDHRIEVVRRRTEFELRKARDREHILLGFQKALDNLDEVIRLIRAAGAPREAREALIARFEFSEKQAQAIIELQLQRLTGMERQKILDELAESSAASPSTWNPGLRQSSARPHRQGAEGSPEGVSATSAAPRSSKTPARSCWKTWWPWKTWPSP